MSNIKDNHAKLGRRLYYQFINNSNISYNKNTVELAKQLYIKLINISPKNIKYNPQLFTINDLVDFKGISIDTIDSITELAALDTLNEFESSPKNIIKLRQNMLDILNKCKCCDRHQTNKPSIYQPWIETKFHNTPDSYLSCSCSCRHVSRMICRQCTN